MFELKTLVTEASALGLLLAKTRLASISINIDQRCDSNLEADGASQGVGQIAQKDDQKDEDEHATE